MPNIDTTYLKNFGAQSRSAAPYGIVVHYVGNPKTSGKANAGYFSSNSDGVGIHFVVGLNGEIYECTDPKYWVVHCGGTYNTGQSDSYGNKGGSCKGLITNRNSIGIEVCHNNSDSYEAATYNSLVELVKSLMSEYSIPVERVVRHFDTAGKTCPPMFITNKGTYTWEMFRKALGGTAKVVPPGTQVSDGNWSNPYTGGASSSSTSSNTAASSSSYSYSSSETSNATTCTISFGTYDTEYQTKTVQYTQDQVFYADQSTDVANNSLLSYPNLVETPFVQLKAGSYTFGTYKNNNTGVQYPNYIQSLKIEKVNGYVNQYTIELIHKIEAGADPNIIDKILSTVGIGQKVYISYGDYNEPSYTYKEEEALLLQVQSNVDFKSSKISYTLTCTSNATALYSKLHSFKAVSDKKPSDIIKSMLYSNNDQYGLLSVFPAMKDQVFGKKCIASDDKVVEIPAQTSMNPLAYLNLLVTYMCSVSNTDASEPLKDSTYKLCLYDTTIDNDRKTTGDDVKGAYFKVVKLNAGQDNTTLATNGVYEVDIGYPTTGNVLDFQVKDDESWAILYNYAGQIKETVYNIDKNGDLTAEYLPKIAMSTKLNKMTEYQKTWWTNMTQFPIHATLTLKGLVTPVMLMDYVRINAIFYGQRHVASGLYVIESQTDTISASGYRTQLDLLRIAGDNAYIKKVLVTRETQLAVRTVSSTESFVTGLVNGLKSIGSSIISGTKTVVNSVVTAGQAIVDGVVTVVDKAATGVRNIANDVVNGINTNAYEDDGSSNTAASQDLQGINITNAQKVLNALLGIGCTKEGACGVLGNLALESGIFAYRIQGDFETGYSKSITYAKTVDNGTVSRYDFCHKGPGGGGFGIAQWTWYTRKEGLYDLTVGQGYSIADIDKQCEYLVKEIKGEPGVYNKLKTTTNTVEAAKMFCNDFEKPNASQACMSSRTGYATAFYRYFYGS